MCLFLIENLFCVDETMHSTHRTNVVGTYQVSTVVRVVLRLSAGRQSLTEYCYLLSCILLRLTYMWQHVFFKPMFYVDGKIGVLVRIFL